jgi:hypothetical protein
VMTGVRPLQQVPSVAACASNLMYKLCVCDYGPLFYVYVRLVFWLRSDDWSTPSPASTFT